MSDWVIYCFLGPLLVSMLLWLFRVPAGPSRWIGIGTLGVSVLFAVQALLAAHAGEIGVLRPGGWPMPFGITYVVDRLSALFLVIAAVLGVTALLALRSADHGERTVQRSVPLLLALVSGLSGAFLSGDLFHLFVLFELVLVCSYLLLQIPGTARALDSGFSNVIVNVLASTLFMVACGVLYSQCGSLSLADLALRVPEMDPTLRLAAGGMLATAFGIKAGLVPLSFWLVTTYPATAGPIAAFFAGLMTKLGVYALMRTTPVLFAGTAIPEALVWAGAASAFFGVVAALAVYELRRLLSFHIVSQVGYMVLGLGTMSVLGLAGALFYLCHHVLVKAALFVVSDRLEIRDGTRDLRRMRPRTGMLLALGFMLAAGSLAGLPPFSGFVAKLALFKATVVLERPVLLVVLIVASLLTLASMVKVWQHAFQPDAGRELEEEDAPGAVPARSVSPGIALGLLVAMSVGVAIFAGPIWDYAKATAEQLLEADAWAQRVFEVGASRGE
jgi:multicomponent Na+:H+ antiporter subunit D